MNDCGLITPDRAQHLLATAIPRSHDRWAPVCLQHALRARRREVAFAWGRSNNKQAEVPDSSLAAVRRPSGNRGSVMPEDSPYTSAVHLHHFRHLTSVTSRCPQAVAGYNATIARSR